jgi:hypothetical protein
MTTAARKVLADCRAALEMLEEEDNLQRWRIVLVSTLALMRGVANVLETFDCQTPFQRRVFEVMRREWGSLPEHAVFQQFIMVGRSLVISDYVPVERPDKEPPLDLYRIEHDTSLKLNWDIFDLRNDIFDAATAVETRDQLVSGMQAD